MEGILKPPATAKVQNKIGHVTMAGHAGRGKYFETASQGQDTEQRCSRFLSFKNAWYLVPINITAA